MDYDENQLFVDERPYGVKVTISLTAKEWIAVKNSVQWKAVNDLVAEIQNAGA